MNHINIKRYIALLLSLAFFAFFANGQSGEDSVVIQGLLQRCTKYQFTKNNKIEVFKSGRDNFLDMFAEINKAKHSIHLDYFNFRNDSIGNSLFDLLAKKARQGIEVRAIFDAFGNLSNNKPLKKANLDSIRSRGIEIYKFRPIRFPYIDKAFNRDHRKIVVIDGKIAYTGGMNVADYYIDGIEEIGKWRDIHIKIEGDAVAAFQDLFLKLWNKLTKQNIGGDVYFPEPDTLNQGNKKIIVVDRTPNVNPSGMRNAYAISIAAAKKTIKIVNPYFIPTHKVKKALKDAIKRGVNVEIMISAKSDISFTPDAAITVAHSLMKRGAKVWLFKGGFHHSKIMMVDGEFCTVGSANLDSRSLRYDYEVNTFIFDKEVTNDLTKMFDKDTKLSIELTPEVWEQRKCWKKFVGNFARLLTPVL